MEEATREFDRSLPIQGGIQDLPLIFERAIELRLLEENGLACRFLCSV